LDNVVGEQPKKVLGELGGFKRNGESAWGRKGKSKSKTHNVGAVAAAELVHAVRGRAGAADAPGVARVAGSADVAGLEEVLEPWGVGLANATEVDIRARNGRLVRESFIFGSGLVDGWIIGVVGIVGSFGFGGSGR
jgi:hypothetical protein